MLHPYKHQLLHKQQSHELVQQAEHDRLVQLVSLNSSQPQIPIALHTFISKWWKNRWTVINENTTAGGKIVMPEA